jgi:hypothetical protein
MSKFVFEPDVLSCSSDADCKRLKKLFVEQSCWREQIVLQKCELSSMFPLCLKEREDHLQCFRRVVDEINAKMKNK